MKGKVSFYFEAPNIGKVRSRLEEAPKEFSANMREAINDVLAEVINENVYSVRAKLVKKFAEQGLTVKKNRTAELSNPLNAFFDVYVQRKPISGADSDEMAEEEATDETEQAAAKEEVTEAATEKSSKPLAKSKENAEAKEQAKEQAKVKEEATEAEDASDDFED